jgi:putative transposase
MKYNPQIHHRRSIRLKGYDYSQAGLYFITICVKNRECLFGNIADGEMVLNDAGIMINKWWQKIHEKFPDIESDVYQIMPNHFHAIVINNGIGVGVDPRVNPDDGNNPQNDGIYTNAGQTRGSAPTILGEHDNTVLGEHMGSPLHRVIQWFKTMITNEYIRGVKNLNWQPFDGKLWQRNYWEHIIRNDGSYNRIAEYIVNNPAKWADDQLNPEKK